LLLLCLTTETKLVFKTLWALKKLVNGQSKKKKKTQSTLVLLCASLFSTLGIAGLGLAWHGPVQSDPFLHLMREFKTPTYI
jgi:hypothetical protein